MCYQGYNLFATGFTHETSSCSCAYVLFVFCALGLQLLSLILFYLFHFPPYSLPPFSSSPISSSSQCHSICFSSLFFSNSPLHVFEFTVTTSLISHCLFAALHFVVPHLFLPFCVSQHLLCLLSLCVSVHYVLDVCPTSTPHHNMAHQVRSLDTDNFK